MEYLHLKADRTLTTYSDDETVKQYCDSGSFPLVSLLKDPSGESSVVRLVTT